MRFLVLLVLACSGFLHGQEKMPRVAASFYCFQYATGLEDIHVRTGAKAFQEVQLSTANMIGPLAVVVAKGTITLHRHETADDGTETYPLVGTAKLGSIRKPLVVLFPSPAGEQMPYRALVIDRSDTKFPLGSYQFINLAPYPMRGLVGKTRLDARPGSVNNLRPKGTPGEILNVIFEFNDGERWRPMTQTRWAVRDDRRSLICAYLDPLDKRVKMRSIPERLVPPAEDP